MIDLSRRLTAEALGTGLLVAAVGGCGWALRNVTKFPPLIGLGG